jgi:class 3 adenylate cyclase
MASATCTCGAVSSCRPHRRQFRGPVVAGVIGRKKFIYDLWGATVNLASRMESHGQSGAIRITRSTYDLVRAQFDCESAGTIQVKGAGAVEVWRVIGREAGKPAEAGSKPNQLVAELGS